MLKDCDKAFCILENTREMNKTFACDSCFLHFLGVPKCPSWNIIVDLHAPTNKLLCTPATQSSVCMTVENSPNSPRVQDEAR